MKKGKLGIAILVAVLVLCVGAVFLLQSLNANTVQDEKLKVSILKLGKADCIVLESAGKTMVLDTGEMKDAEKVSTFLKQENITTIDYLVITHFDKDHVGAAGSLVEQFNVGHLYIPNYEGTVNEYFDFMEAMEAALVTPERVADITTFSFGEAEVTIEPPLKYDVNVVADVVDDYDNTLSLMTTVTCGEKRLLFAADADRRRLTEWLEGSELVGHYDFLKVPHHGKFNAGLEPLLEAITPQYAAITCSKKNPADTQTTYELEKYDVETFTTQGGIITLRTDGISIEVLQN